LKIWLSKGWVAIDITTPTKWKLKFMENPEAFEFTGTKSKQ